MQHPAEAARRIGATAETEDVNVVARLKVPHQKLVGICHVVRNPVTECLTNELRPPVANTAEGATRTHRADTGVIVVDLGFVADEGLIDLHYIGVLSTKLIASAVATDHDILGHEQS